jgi:transposase-like protein
MSILSEPHFHNEAAAIARLEAIVWPQGPFCPRCGGFDRITPVKGGRAGLRRCGPCKREFTVTVGTVFERSHVKLHKWFQAAHLMASSKKGISAHQLHRTLKVTYKTAWFMEHRLREAMREGHFSTPIGGANKTVEMDETYIGGRERNKHASKRRTWNVGVILEAQLHGKTTLYTDDLKFYRTVKPRLRPAATINHSAGEYVRGDVHTNTVESYFSILKRGINGVYHHVSQQHLKRYLAEFDFRYNERAPLASMNEARADNLLRGIVGKRLTYKDSSPASI